MKLAVKDANILIDLVNGDLLAACLGLPYEFLTTEAARRLRLVQALGAFLPRGECEDRLRRWDWGSSLWE